MQNITKKFSVNLPIEKTNTKTEVIAGITTFLAMAYIIAVNPDILSKAGMPQGALVTATCLSAGFTTILMGLYAKLPLGLASGMGLNAFFAFTVVLQMGVHWTVALTAVFVEGIIFILLSLFKVREAVVNCIPKNLKYAVTAGIGLFIAFIGMQNAGLVVKNDATLVSLGTFKAPTVIIAFIGIIIIAVLEKKKIKGAILWGILSSTLIAWFFAFFKPEVAASYRIFLPQGFFKFESIAPIAMKLDFSLLTSAQGIVTFIGIVFTFLFVDFFDTVGTLVGVASRANMLDKKGNMPNAGKALLVDAIGTTTGALMGVSAVTTYVESSTGVEAGGRTGLTAVVTGILFLIAMFFSPIFIAIPSCATAAALIYVGYLMLGSVKNIDFSEITEALPAFLTIAMMPLTYSIGDGLIFGVLSYVILNLLNNIFSKEKKQVSFIMIILAVIFMIKLIL
ncbi:NCS2 family permease [Clostridium fallax]|uniref:Putative MFS transporter, AGZA family, xanthine/uracil permease n=1 Tax=Clostridium fallax TaxID=1533 RepID=A0A1M4X5V9_9CLOT|nr:NCS2 family permease [Clostridium fallax]SHE88904.1 putative MFS transporter, AGZA family, xanthine/uracil permease [Clostridium fallax]SQB07313.1 inner membrane protein YicO [Clostridium fallax]